jgi:hypothetical protein
VLVYFIHVNQYAYVNDVDEDFVGKLNELEPKMKQRVSFPLAWPTLEAAPNTRLPPSAPPLQSRPLHHA